MSTAHEIEAAICTLSPDEREKLIKNLPVLLPSWTATWHGIKSWAIRAHGLVDRFAGPS
jgi:hypothetical protein